MIILWAGVTLFLTVFLLWIGQSVRGYALWLGLAVAISAVWMLVPDRRIWLPALLGLVTVSSLGTFALEWLYDFSGDGQEYHLPGILALAQGWNPFHSPRLAEWDPGFEAGVTSGIFVQHYAKGAWLLAATSFRGTGLLEGAKIWNLLYPLAALLVAQAILRRVGLGRAWSWGLALAIAVNPVGVYQLPSFYVDGQLAALFTLALLFSLDYLRQPARHTLLFVAVSLVLLANVKFTGLVYAVFLVFSLAGGAWWWKKRTGLRSYLLMACLSLLVAVIVVGYQPYITNTLQQGHPFYPAVGREDGRNVQWRSAPPEFLAMNRVEKLAYSLGSQSSGSSGAPAWKIPFSVEKQELYAFFTTDVRYGGFGPWFGGILLLALAGVPWMLRGRATGLIAGVGLLVIMSGLLNPEAWWARLSPQFWLVPPLLIMSAVLNRTTWLRMGATVVLMALLVNSLLAGAMNWGRAVQKNLAFRNQLAQLSATPDAPVWVNIPRRFRLVTENRLQNQGINYRLADPLPCRQPLPFSYPESARSEACLAGLEGFPIPQASPAVRHVKPE
ncbi:MAG: hypothetical protein Q8K12_03400 [Thiobacillus sp.]|nr:hypothetical protein [Thiobacillus sp.]